MGKRRREKDPKEDGAKSPKALGRIIGRRVGLKK